VLETSRLWLRELTEADVDDLYEVLGDPSSMRFYPHPFSRDEVVRWIEWSRRISIAGRSGKDSRPSYRNPSSVGQLVRHSLPCWHAGNAHPTGMNRTKPMRKGATPLREVQKKIR
jgi:GNAT acetyltransferase-like protein